MGIIRRLLGDIVSRPVTVRRSTDTSKRDSVSLQDEVRRMCAKGPLGDVGAMLAARLSTPATTSEAQDLMRTVIAPVIAECADRGDSKTACDLENLVAYPRLMKAFEDPKHHEACFDTIDGAMHALGRKDGVAAPSELARPVERILFFAHNLGTDFAHLTLLCDLIDAYLGERPQDAYRIGLAGPAGGSPSPRVRKLQERWGLSVWTFPVTHRFRDVYLGAARLLDQEDFDRLVVVSVPTGLSYLSGVLPAWRLGWLTMKYQLACFEHLRHRCSFYSPGPRRDMVVDGRNWRQATGLFKDDVQLAPTPILAPEIQEARRYGVVFYTVNREEKIRHPGFLDSVARILAQVDDSVFVWTGRARLAEIDGFFAARGLQDRHVFAGWVNPDDLLQAGDIFLDTPVLSGVVAARAAALGIPVLMYEDAINWIGAFLPTYLADKGTALVAHLDTLILPLEAQGILLRGASHDQYVEQAVRLAKDPELRLRFGQALGAYARHYFFNASRSAIDHFSNLRAPALAEEPLQHSCEHDR